MNAANLLAEAIAHHQAGRLGEAERYYRQVLAADPRHPDAIQLLGVIAHQVGKHETAVALIRDAISLRPEVAEYHNNCGEVLRLLGRAPEASAAFREAIRLRPAYAEAHNNLGNALREAGELTAAIAAYDQAIRLRPEYAEAHNNLGNALQDRGETERAVASYQRALAVDRNRAEIQNNLGTALHRLGRLEEAIDALTAARQLAPANAIAWNNLGRILKQADRAEQALAAFDQAIALQPGFAEAHANRGDLLAALRQTEAAALAYEESLRLQPQAKEVLINLGGALKDLGRQEEALAAFERALALDPHYAVAHYNRGVVWRDSGNLPAAVEAFRAALTARPDYVLAHSGLVFVLHYIADCTPEEIRREHECWNERHAAPLLRSPPTFSQSPVPHRRLRIGYVSADLRDHAVGRNLHPLVANQDHGKFETFAYSSTTVADAMTQRLQGCFDHWREVRSLDDAALAELIRRDAIDILVDLSLHTGGHRLLVFARRPAPLQVTFAGYPGTTGLATMDYRLTDSLLDPPGRNDAFYVECSFRLPHSFWCFDPLDDDRTPVVRPPRPGTGVTWGCLNNPIKMNATTLALWARVLHATPSSRLLLLAYPPLQRSRIAATLADLGVNMRNVDFLPPQSRAAYLAAYQRCDAILDTFPYNGHTTTCDALWMGTPVLTLAGRHALARGGLSLLSTLGLEDLVAETPDQFVQNALRLAGDEARRAELHRTLRACMEASPLMDGAAFARGIEAAFRTMWRTWCEGQTG